MCVLFSLSRSPSLYSYSLTDYKLSTLVILYISYPHFSSLRVLPVFLISSFSTPEPMTSRHGEDFSVVMT